jgi:hypothetical protein
MIRLVLLDVVLTGAVIFLAIVEAAVVIRADRDR